MQQADHIEVIIPTPKGEEQPDVVDIFLEKTDEGNASPEQQAPVDDVDEEIEVDKDDPSPPRNLQAGPSESNKEETDKNEGELNASQVNATPVASSGAPTQMDVDPAAHSTTPQLEEEEIKSDAPMAQEVIAPPVVPQVSEKEVVGPPTEGNSLKEKALLSERQKAVEGVPTSKNDDQHS